MKKLFLLPAIFLASLFFASHVFATSGCCSSHGGVDCAAGPQSNGNVICYDGWRGSSCSYASMVKCIGTSTTTIYVAPTATPTPTPVYVAPIVTVKPTSTPTPEPTATPTPTVTPTPTPEITATPTITQTPTVTPTSTPTPLSNVKGASTESLIWKFHWWNFSPLMSLFGAIFGWK